MGFNPFAGRRCDEVEDADVKKVWKPTSSKGYKPMEDKDISQEEYLQTQGGMTVQEVPALEYFQRVTDTRLGFEDLKEAYLGLWYAFGELRGHYAQHKGPVGPMDPTILDYDAAAKDKYGKFRRHYGRLASAYDTLYLALFPGSGISVFKPRWIDEDEEDPTVEPQQAPVPDTQPATRPVRTEIGSAFVSAVPKPVYSGSLHEAVGGVVFAAFDMLGVFPESHIDLANALLSASAEERAEGNVSLEVAGFGLTLKMTRTPAEDKYVIKVSNRNEMIEAEITRKAQPPLEESQNTTGEGKLEA